MVDQQCKKKVYYSRSEAKKFMKEVNKQGHYSVKMTSSYYCEICSGYHLTSMPKRASRKFTRRKAKIN